MPFTYTTRKGMDMTLHRVESAKGAVSYVFARPGKSKGEPVDDLPPGYRVSEHAGGKVSLVKDVPRLVLPEEVALVEAEVAKLPKAKDVRVVAQHDRIELYVTVPSGYPNVYASRLSGLYHAAAERDKEEPPKYDPIMRLVLFDTDRRLYRADQAVPGWRVEWSWLGEVGEVAALASAFVPALVAESEREVPFLDFDLALPDQPFGFDPLTIPGVSSASELFAKRRDGADQAERPAAPPTSVHRLKITLTHSRPPIWRRVLVPSDVTLAELHGIVQDGMGWGNEHLHAFTVDGMAIEGPEPSMFFGGPDDLDERSSESDEDLLRLNQVAPFPKNTLRYQYDFGDSWDHTIVVEAVQLPEPGERYPVCVAGARACPPEDVGGVWGYSSFVEAMTDRRHPDRGYYREWWGGKWDAEAFDLDAINQALSR